MADDEKKDRRRHIVHVLRFHTHKGEEHNAGESYEVEEGEELDNLTANGMVSTDPPKPPETPA